MYISLDIETTGLSPDRDDIIEIGAVKFDENGFHESFQSLIHYDGVLPELVKHITGITDEDLEDAPSLEEMADSLYEFIGDLPVLGHNINFDMDFLKAKGFNFSNQLFDSLPLAQILKPGLPTYSLDMLTEQFKITHKDKHRALDDAKATAELFNLLIKGINNINKTTLDRIKDIVSKSNWPLKEIFMNAESHKEAEAKQRDEHKEESDTLKFANEEILKHFKNNSVVKNFEKRDPQIEMAEKISDAFEQDENLIIEAGTGTGKSLAYLIPSVYKALSGQTKVVIATHTKNLQDQLYNKDLITAQKSIGANFKTAVLKGRQNYISVERLNNYMKKSFFYDHEVTMLIKILTWLPQTENGEKGELSLFGREHYTWLDVCCDGIKCPHNNADYANKCFLNKARIRAGKADVVITNHSLILTDTIGPVQILPEYKYLVVDEAHHLESEATNALTIMFTLDSINRPLNNLKDLLKREPELTEKIKELQGKAEIFFGLLGICYEKFIKYANNIQALTVSDYVRESIEWERLKGAAESIVIKAEDLYKTLTQNENLKDYIEIEMEAIAEIARKLGFVILEDGVSDFGQSITWMFVKMDQTLGIKCAPLQVREHLRGTLLNDKNSIIMTSATLSVDHKFDYIKCQLGLDEDFEGVILPSPFKYEDQVEVIFYKDMKAPATPGYFDETCEIIKNEAIRNGGKMLVLFTSKKAIQATYLKLAPELKTKNIAILAQNLSGGRNKIIELFKRDPEKSIIFGTNSFWEGIDIKGAALDTVIIQKLPFDPPDDPIHSARGRLFDDPFNEYQVPRAILRFKQGFGRLIRSTKDSGRVIVLDSRVLSKSYGEMFLNSLPEGVAIKFIK